MPIYMNYEGIKGDAKGKYLGWIELDSCQLGSHRNPNGNNHGPIGVTSLSEIVVTKHQDSSSTHLFREAINGQGKKVTIEFVTEDSSAYLSIELENALILSYSISGGSGGGKPYESFSLNFTKVSYTTKATSASSDPKHTQNTVWWDLATKKGSP